jgi:hypothetical protein
VTSFLDAAQDGDVDGALSHTHFHYGGTPGDAAYAQNLCTLYARVLAGMGDRRLLSVVPSGRGGRLAVLEVSLEHQGEQRSEVLLFTTNERGKISDCRSIDVPTPD